MQMQHSTPGLYGSPTSADTLGRSGVDRRALKDNGWARSAGAGAGGGLRRSGPRAEGTLGRAALFPVALLALAALAWVALRGAGGPAGQAAPADAQGAVAPERPLGSAGAAPGETGAASPLAAPARPEGTPVPIGGIEVGAPADWASLGKVFEGTGTIAVDLRLDAGVTAPEEWTLHLAPSLSAEGRAHAVARSTAFPGRLASAEVRDVPLGGYRVFAAAPGLASAPQEVVLHKIEGYEHLPGVTWVRLTLTLRRASAVGGTLLDGFGAGAEECAVALRELGGERVHTAVTGPGGGYRFDAVAPGAYALWIGSEERPLLPASRVDVTGGDVAVPTLRLPPYITLDVRVVDWLDRGVPDADVRGYLTTDGRGSFEGRTDSEGHLRVRYLNPGAWRLRGAHTELSLRGDLDLQLGFDTEGTAGGVQRATLFLAADPDKTR